jgi:uncharacterized membrane protein
MGCADVIPGVSGGTVAFISGIYEELIDSIKSIDREALRLLFGFRISDFWKKINGNFLISVLAGIVTSLLSLSKLMTYLLEHHPISIWSFFFGLILVSSPLILRDSRICNRRSSCLPDYDTVPDTNTHKFIFHFLLRCPCHLCDDFARNFRRLHPAADW